MARSTQPARTIPVCWASNVSDFVLGVRAGQGMDPRTIPSYRDFIAATYIRLHRNPILGEFVEGRLLLGLGPWFAHVRRVAVGFLDAEVSFTRRYSGREFGPARLLPHGDTEVMLRGLTGFKVSDHMGHRRRHAVLQMTRALSAFPGFSCRQDPLFRRAIFTLTLAVCYYDSTEANAGGAGCLRCDLAGRRFRRWASIDPVDFFLVPKLRSSDAATGRESSRPISRILETTPAPFAPAIELSQRTKYTNMVLYRGLPFATQQHA